MRGAAVLLAPLLLFACVGLFVRERVILSPASANIRTGDVQQFQAQDFVGRGSTEAVPVAYSATGGTITSEGTYTAGSVPGSYEVIASVKDGALADTSDITVREIGAYNSYSTDFSSNQNPISEGGRWINGEAVGLDWHDVRTVDGLAYGLQDERSYSDATALLAGLWGPDQAVSATVYADPPMAQCAPEVELRLRSAISASTNRGYEVSFAASETSSAYLIIVRWNGAWGDFDYIQTGRWVGAQYGVRTGDVVRATIVGDTITAYKNGVALAQVTDTTFTTGNPGIGFNLENAPAGCAGTNGTYGFRTFTATDSLVR